MHESARKRADAQVRQRFRGRALRQICGNESESIFLPDFAEALAFAVVIAKYLHSVPLPQPAMHLFKELAALQFGNVEFRGAIGDRPEGVEAGKPRIQGCFFAEFQPRMHLLSNAGPGD